MRDIGRPSDLAGHQRRQVVDLARADALPDASLAVGRDAATGNWLEDGPARATTG